jgi:hypothetical protein
MPPRNKLSREEGSIRLAASIKVLTRVDKDSAAYYNECNVIRNDRLYRFWPPAAAVDDVYIYRQYIDKINSVKLFLMCEYRPYNGDPDIWYGLKYLIKIDSCTGFTRAANWGRRDAEESAAEAAAAAKAISDRRAADIAARVAAENAPVQGSALNVQLQAELALSRNQQRQQLEELRDLQVRLDDAVRRENQKTAEINELRFMNDVPGWRGNVDDTVTELNRYAILGRQYMHIWLRLNLFKKTVKFPVDNKREMLLYYHPDKQAGTPKLWVELCGRITERIVTMY